MGVSVQCPFYVADKRASISCEDCIRQYDSREEKLEWRKKYCESDWRKCQYAAALSSLYDRLESVPKDKRELEALKFRNNAAIVEINSLKKSLGKVKAEKEQLSRDNYALDHVLRTERAVKIKHTAKIELLEMMCGFVLDKLGENTIITSDMAEFFAKYEIKWQSVEGGCRLVKVAK